MSTTRAVWVFVIVLTAIRLALLGTTDLSFDEAHYWMWSDRLAPGYFSKGPGVAFAIRASTALFGATEFGVRFWSPILGAGTSLLLYYFTRRLYSADAGLWVVLAMNVTPIFNIGNLVMTIDPLSVFFWTAAMFSFWLATERSPTFSWYWPLTGLLIGLGFLCKYTNALELVSILLVLALAPRLRREFRQRGLYLLLVVFVLCTLPPILWNSQHAWATLSHLRSRGSLDAAPGFHPLELLDFLLQHFGVYSPLLFLGLAVAVIASWRRVNQQFKVLFLMWFGLPVFGFYLLLSVNKSAAPNWDALAVISLAVLAVSYWRERLESRRWIFLALAAAFLMGIFSSVLALNSDLIRTAGLHLWRRDPADRMRGWKASAEAIEHLRADVEKQLGEKVFMIADERDRASELSFYLHDKRIEGPGHPPVYITESQDIRNQFSFWPRYDEFSDAPPDAGKRAGEVYTEEKGENRFAGRSALFVSGKHKVLDVPHNIRAAFQSADRVATIEVRRFGRPVRAFDVFLCRNYRTLPL